MTRPAGAPLEPRDRRSAVGDQSLRAVIDGNVDGMVVVDHDGLVLFANPAAEALFGGSAAQLIGAHFGFPCVSGESANIIVVSSGERTVLEMRSVAIQWAGSPADLASLRDVTERARAQDQLTRTAAEQAAIARLGELGLSGRDAGEILIAAVGLVRNVLGADACAILGAPLGREEFPIVAATGLPEELGRPSTAAARSAAGHALATGMPVVIEDAAADTRFAPWPASPELTATSSVTSHCTTPPPDWRTGRCSLIASARRCSAPGDAARRSPSCSSTSTSTSTGSSRSMTAWVIAPATSCLRVSPAGLGGRCERATAWLASAGTSS